MNNYHRIFNGYFVGSYSAAKWRTKSKSRYIGLELMSKEDWKLFLEDTIEDRKVLWDEYVASGFKLRFAPSLDRIDPTKGYIQNNCRWIRQHENSARNRGVDGSSWNKGLELYSGKWIKKDGIKHRHNGHETLLCGLEVGENRFSFRRWRDVTCSDCLSKKAPERLWKHRSKRGRGE